MKALKIYSILISIVAVILVCVVAYMLGSQNSTTQNTSLETAYDYVDVSNENTAVLVAESSTTDNSTTTETTTDSTTTDSTTQTTTDEYIGTDRAKEIALEHAGLSASDVTWGKCELDVDFNSADYELEFYYNNQEYDYEIDAKTGEVTAYEVDNR